MSLADRSGTSAAELASLMRQHAPHYRELQKAKPEPPRHPLRDVALVVGLVVAAYVVAVVWFAVR